MDSVAKRQPAPYSAGSVIFRLKPGEEGVVLVLNIDSEEIKRVHKSHLTNAERRRVVDDLGDEVIVSFNQPGNFGTPFGKGEPGDEDSRVNTARRETLEETGRDISDRIIESVSYTEVPSSWGTYSNTVYLVNGCGFSVRSDQIKDPLVDPHYTKFYHLARLPFFKRPKNRHERNERARRKDIRYRAGIYNAAIRRLIAILLQLNRPLLTELGRTGCDTADDLVQVIIKRWAYGAFFSRRTMKMLISYKREDIILDRLCNEDGKITSFPLAQQIGGNLILAVTDEALLERGLEALIARCDRDVLTGGEENLYKFLGMRFERRRSRILSSLDRKVIEAEEEALDRELAEEVAGVEEEEMNTADFEAIWLAAEANQEAARTHEPGVEPAEGGESMPVVKAPSFVACIGANRACGRASRDGGFTCAEHEGATISMPPRILIRQHFKATSRFGAAIVDELLSGGVRLVERSRVRQSELELRRMYSTGVRVFGQDDIGPNVAVKSAASEMEAVGYRLKEVHVLSLDNVTESEESVGDRTVVSCYEFDPSGDSIKLPEVAEVLLTKPFLSCRVWVNLVDASGSQLHSVELIGYQHQARPGVQLKFLNSLWFPEVAVRY